MAAIPHQRSRTASRGARSNASPARVAACRNSLSNCSHSAGATWARAVRIAPPERSILVVVNVTSLSIHLSRRRHRHRWPFCAPRVAQVDGAHLHDTRHEADADKVITDGRSTGEMCDSCSATTNVATSRTTQVSATRTTTNNSCLRQSGIAESNDDPVGESSRRPSPGLDRSVACRRQRPGGEYADVGAGSLDHPACASRSHGVLARRRAGPDKFRDHPAGRPAGRGRMGHPRRRDRRAQSSSSADPRWT